MTWPPSDWQFFSVLAGVVALCLFTLILKLVRWRASKALARIEADNARLRLAADRRYAHAEHIRQALPTSEGCWICNQVRRMRAVSR
jgi:hypothetical protein